MTVQVVRSNVPEKWTVVEAELGREQTIGGIECLLLMILIIIRLITKTQNIIKHINLLRMSENSLYYFNTVRNALDISTYFQ